MQVTVTITAPDAKGWSNQCSIQIKCEKALITGDLLDLRKHGVRHDLMVVAEEPQPNKPQQVAGEVSVRLLRDLQARPDWTTEEFAAADENG